VTRVSVASQVFIGFLCGWGATLRGMKTIKKFLAAGTATAVIGIGVAGFGGGSDATSAGGAATAAATTAQASTSEAPAGGGGPGGGVAATSVTTEAQLVELIQEAYGDASLGLHRGHQDVESTLIDVLGISHDEMHVRMESQGQNLAAVATDLGIDPQALIDALVETRSPAIDTLLENRTITQEQADGYLRELEEAYTFRVNWDGQQATPTARAVS
jgi:hypothetical protein